ncbi:MAG: pilus assembly protein PilP [Limnohabitans sp.]
MLVGTAWVSAEAWDSWWQSDERALQIEQDMHTLELQLQQHRSRMANLQAQPHPAGFGIPAWQAWPDDMPPDLKQVLRAWLAWGRLHGLTVQAHKMDEAMASGRWTGSLPQLMTAWHGLPTAVPRMVITGFEWRIKSDPLLSPARSNSPILQLQMQWVVLKERLHANESATKHLPKPHASAANGASSGAETARPTVRLSLPPSASYMYNPFSIVGLQKALPSIALSGNVLLDWQTRPLSQLRWVGMLANGHQRQALVHGDGQVHTVDVGDRLGQDWGVITEIGRDHLRLREWVADAQGKWVSRERCFPAGAAS